MGSMVRLGVLAGLVANTRMQLPLFTQKSLNGFQDFIVQYHGYFIPPEGERLVAALHVRPSINWPGAAEVICVPYLRGALVIVGFVITEIALFTF